MSEQKIIGIDLGTTNSCVSVVVNGRPVVIPNSEGYNTTPSIVAFTNEGERLVGQLAKRQAVMNPEKTIESIKRHMGTKYKVQVAHREFSPEQISAFILQKLKKQAQEFLGERVNKAIITVPAYFDDAQRLATRDAGQIAGLEVVRIVNEPTACALTYGMHKSPQKSTVVVFDFGGGTFDVTVLEISEGVLHVRATNGNNQLGGYDFDSKIAQWIVEQVSKQHGVDVTGNAVAVQRLKEAAENAKVELSSSKASNIQLPFLAMDRDNLPINFDCILTVDDFNRLTADLVASAKGPVEKALADAKISVEDVQNIILAGGTTRVPAVQKLIKDMFQKDPVRAVNPDEAVAMGAAIQGGIMTGELDGILLLDVIPMSVGLEKPDGKIDNLFRRNIVIPINKAVSVSNDSERQASIRMHVVQGEDELAANNKSLARISIPVPDLAPANTFKVDVEFNVDVDGIFICKATDKQTQKPVDIELVRTHGLSREELKTLADEAAKQAEEEHFAQERNKAALQAQCCLQDAERVLAKYTDTISEAKQMSIRQTMNSLRNALLEDELAKLPQKMQELNELLSTSVMGASTHPRPSS
jgi:molecular chaperone DnaK